MTLTISVVQSKDSLEGLKIVEENLFLFYDISNFIATRYNMPSFDEKLIKDNLILITSTDLKKVLNCIKRKKYLDIELKNNIDKNLFLILREVPEKKIKEAIKFVNKISKSKYPIEIILLSHDNVVYYILLVFSDYVNKNNLIELRTFFFIVLSELVFLNKEFSNCTIMPVSLLMSFILKYLYYYYQYKENDKLILQEASFWSLKSLLDIYKIISEHSKFYNIKSLKDIVVKNLKNTIYKNIPQEYPSNVYNKINEILNQDISAIMKYLDYMLFSNKILNAKMNITMTISYLYEKIKYFDLHKFCGNINCLESILKNYISFDFNNCLSVYEIIDYTFNIRKSEE